MEPGRFPSKSIDLRFLEPDRVSVHRWIGPHEHSEDEPHGDVGDGGGCLEGTVEPAGELAGKRQEPHAR